MAKSRDTFLTGGIAGRVGNVLFVQGPSGTYLRSMPARRVGAVSETEREGQEATALVSVYWSGLSPEAMGRWRAYAGERTAARPHERQTVTSGWNEFFTLGKKLLQIDASRPLPTEPPTGRFPGDLVQFEAQAYAAEGEAGVLFVANRPNDEGVLTEFLLQRLANGGRLPTARGYRSQGFVHFEGADEAEIPATPGWYACATRFVEAATGRATALVPCGVVFVG